MDFRLYFVVHYFSAKKWTIDKILNRLQIEFEKKGPKNVWCLNIITTIAIRSMQSNKEKQAFHSGDGLEFNFIGFQKWSLRLKLKHYAIAFLFQRKILRWFCCSQITIWKVCQTIWSHMWANVFLKLSSMKTHTRKPLTSIRLNHLQRKRGTNV